jgi:hypothetical protein
VYFQISEVLSANDLELVMRTLEANLRPLAKRVERSNNQLMAFGIGPSPVVKNGNDRSIFLATAAGAGTCVTVDVNYQASGLLGAVSQDDVVRGKILGAMGKARVELGDFGPAGGPVAEVEGKNEPIAAAAEVREEVWGAPAVDEAVIEPKAWAAEVRKEVSAVPVVEVEVEPKAPVDQRWVLPESAVGEADERDKGGKFAPTNAALARAAWDTSALQTAALDKVALDKAALDETALDNSGLERSAAVKAVVSTSASGVVAEKIRVIEWVNPDRVYVAPVRVPLPAKDLEEQGKAEAEAKRRVRRMGRVVAGTLAVGCVVGCVVGWAAGWGMDLLHEAPPPVAVVVAPNPLSGLHEQDLTMWLQHWAVAEEGRDPVAQAAYYADPVTWYLQTPHVSHAFLLALKEDSIKKKDATTTLKVEDVKVVRQIKDGASIEAMRHFMVLSGDANVREDFVGARLKVKRIDGEWKITEERNVQ